MMMTSSYGSLVPFLLLTALVIATLNESRRSFGEIVSQSGGDSGDTTKGTGWAILDYPRNETTAANLYALLLGNKMALSGGSSKVLNSGPNDHVFFYYTDHGGTGLVCMPVEHYIYANDLMNVLKQMHEAKKHMNMVIHRGV
ncbi:hypothetical protein NL676_007004 [Syzygium grande]|nr:hypothetical protein NL676_007004 [Syzygium grande]